MIKFIRMPVERKSYIVTGHSTKTSSPSSDWEKITDWFIENDVDFSLHGDIMHFKNDIDESQFILRWGADIV